MRFQFGTSFFITILQLISCNLHNCVVEYIILRSFTNKVVCRKLYVTIVKEEKKMISAEEVRKVSEEAQSEEARKAQLKAEKNGGLSFGERVLLYFIERGIKRASKKNSFTYATKTMTPSIRIALKRENRRIVPAPNGKHWIICW